MPLSVGRSMDRQSKREILIVAIGMAVLELPVVAFIALAILSR
jgi:hypothetical protein